MVHWYPKYTPVGVRRARAAVEMHELRERGVTVQPVEVRDRNIARSFWGRRWCEHLESFSDYANRLAGGRTYVLNGSVCHLAVEPGRIEAMVAGRELYRVVVRIRQLERPAWKAIEARAGQIGSVRELLQGRLSDRVMDIVAHRDTGLFPQPGEIELACDCPDRATMCKHAAAVLYGVGSRLDDSPELLFRLRGVDEAELIAADAALPRGAAGADTRADGDLGDVFDVALDPTAKAPAPHARKPGPRTGPAGPPAPSARKPTASAAPAGAAGATAAGSLKPEASTGPIGAAGPPAPGARKPTASAAPAGAADGPAANSLKPVAITGAAGGLAADSSKPAADTAPVPKEPKKAPGPRTPRADRPTALPPREDAAAAAPRFRPTGALIAKLRKRCGFSVAEFAELLQVSGTTVRRWEGASGPLDLHARSREALTVLRLEIEKRQE